MNAKDILSPMFDSGLLKDNTVTRDLPFEAYQKLQGVNASILKNETTLEMLAYTIGMSQLDAHERHLAEQSGDFCADVLKRVEMTAPRTVPVKTVHLARNVLETDKLSDVQRSIVEELKRGPLDSRDIKGTTLVSLDNKGLIRYDNEERVESGLKDEVKEGHAMALAIGEATHRAILEPHLFDADEWQKHMVLSPTKGITTSAAKDVHAEHPGKSLITPEIIDTARRCRDAVYEHRLAAELLNQPGDNEITLQAWHDDALCWRKARLDRLPKDPKWGIVDIKTTHTGLGLHQLKSAIYKFQYHLQAAYYLDTLAGIEGKVRDHFHFVFVTKTAPFMCRCVEINTAPDDQNFTMKGRDIYLERLAAFSVAWHQETWEAYQFEPLTTLRA